MTEENKTPENQNENPTKNTPENPTPEADNEPTQPELTLRPEIGVTGFRDMKEEMETCYLDYAMSVIVARALPDVRDGLKPVHRRILYTMGELGLRSTAKYRKSAAVVGDVLGKYHPHGDAAVYQSMVRMAQDFSMRYPLVDGQGNFGSIDGDSAAAMRYTEARMDKMAEDMLADLDKETVDFRPNYDETRSEPTVLPARVPQLLVNGSLGIAVGMATSIPPHNLGEIVDATIHMIDTPEATVEDLLQHVKGPDLPTGGIAYDGGAVREAYSTGRGSITTRAVAEIQEMKNGRHQIVVTEIPYQVNKSNLINKMADLVRDKKIVGISDIRDESSSEGIRIVIEIQKNAYPNKILNQLYKNTQLQENISYNMIALIDGIQPRLLNLKNILEEFIKHRDIVVTRRTEYELKIAKARAHILEGLRIALDQIDAVISTIRASKTKEEARENLIKKFELSELQANAILDMRLQALAGLERQKIEDEYKEKIAFIAECEAILADKQKVMQIVKDELAEVKAKYNSPRRTVIKREGLNGFSAKDTIPNAPMVVMLTEQNYIKRLPPASFRAQNRGGKGIIGTTTKENDEVRILRDAMNHDELMFFTSRGRVFTLPTYEIPQSSRQAKGTPIINLLQLDPEERVTAILNAGEKLAGQYLIMCTHGGTIKKTPIAEFKNIRRSGLIAIKLKEDDSLEWVRETSPGEQIMIITREGKSIRFDERDIRPMGRPSQGVRGIRLANSDHVVEMDTLRDPDQAALLVIMENGLGKKTIVSSYRLQARGGTGVKTASITKKTGKVVGATIIEDSDGDLVLISSSGQTLRTALSSIPTRGRATQGVFLMRIPQSTSIASLTVIPHQPDTPEEKPETPTETKKETNQPDKVAVGTTVKLSDKPKKESKKGLNKLLKAAEKDKKDQSK